MFADQLGVALQIATVLLSWWSLWLIGEKKRGGLIIGMLTQGVWMFLFVHAQLYVMCLTPVVYAALYLRGLLKWANIEDPIILNLDGRKLKRRTHEVAINDIEILDCKLSLKQMLIARGFDPESAMSSRRNEAMGATIYTQEYFI